MTVDNGLTETMKHKISHSAGPQNAATGFHSVLMQLLASAMQEWCRDFSTISDARVSVLQPGRNGDTSVDTVEAEPHLEALMQHVAGRLALSGSSTAAETSVLMDFVRALPHI